MYSCFQWHTVETILQVFWFFLLTELNVFMYLFIYSKIVKMISFTGKSRAKYIVKALFKKKNIYIYIYVCKKSNTDKNLYRSKSNLKKKKMYTVYI